MSKNLTAQQLADELNVTRQLIYYHAKKLPKDSKTYDEDNTLVFTPDQQTILKSYMTDTVKEKTIQKNEKNSIEKISPSLEKSSEIMEEIDRNTVKSDDKAAVKDVSNAMSNEMTNDKSEDDKEESGQENVSTNETVKAEEVDEDGGTASYEKSVTVKDYIQQAVKDHLEMQKKADSEERQTLIGELEEKNAQISTLHKLLDQQQQLALVTEQKHQKLLETLGVEDEKQLKAIVELTTNDSDSSASSTETSTTTTTTESSETKDIYEGKNWFQRLFKL